MPYANRFLASLSPGELDMLGELEPISFAPGDVLIRAGALLTHYIFIERGFVSSVATGPSGRLDLGMLPAIGFTGATGFTTSPRRRAIFDYVARVPGTGYRVPAERMHAAVKASFEMRERVRRLTAGAAAGNALNAVCQARHPTEHRCARWWLTIRDGLGSNLIPLAQTALAEMLAVTRQSISHAYGTLIAIEAIDRADGGIVILNTEDLMLRACECYLDWRAIMDEIFIG